MQGENLVIDGSNVLMMALAADLDCNNRGDYIGGTLGFIKRLSSYINQFQPERVFVMFDMGKSKYRKALHPLYKAGRMEHLHNLEVKIWQVENGITPKDAPKTNLDTLRNYLEQRKRFDTRLLATWQLIQLLPLLGVNVVTLPDVESDDLIARMVLTSKRNNTIVSTDKDYLQLIGPHTRVYRPVTGQLVNRNNLAETLGYNPEWIVPMKVLCGDNSDNIDGVDGIGETTAIKIFTEAGAATEDALLVWCSKHVAKQKRAKALLDFLNADRWAFNRKLMDLRDPGLQSIAIDWTTAIRKPQVGLSQAPLYKLLSDIGIDDVVMDDELHDILVPFIGLGCKVNACTVCTTPHGSMFAPLPQYTNTIPMMSGGLPISVTFETQTIGATASGSPLFEAFNTDELE